MRGKFSFLAHYLEIALKQARVMLPGVRRMDAFTIHQKLNLLLPLLQIFLLNPKSH